MNAPRPRGQSGVTVIELLIGMMIVAMLGAPLAGLIFLSFRSEVGTSNRNDAAKQIGLLKANLQRDVGEAEVIDASPTEAEILKCDGGPADNNATRLLTVQSPLEVDTSATPPVTIRMQVDYNFSRAVDQSGNVIPDEYSIWRQACDATTRALVGPPSQIVRSVEVPPLPIDEGNADTDPARCIGGVGDFVDNQCPVVQMKVTPLAEGAITASVTASSRVVTSSGDGQAFDLGDIPVTIKATHTDGTPLTGDEPEGTQVLLSAEFTYGNPVTYAWTMPPGATPKTPGWTPASANGKFQFDSAGRYPIFLYIFDTGNPEHYGTASMSVVIGNKPPIVRVSCGSSVYVDEGAQPCNLMRGSRSLSANDSSDPEGSPLTYAWQSLDGGGSDYDPSVHVRQNYLGGAVIPEGSVDRLVCDPLPPRNDTGCAPSAQVLFNAPGSRTVKVTVTDADGMSTSLLVPIFVVTQPPMVTLTNTTTPRVPPGGGTVTFKAVANLPSPYGPNDKYPWARMITWEVVDANDVTVQTFNDDLGAEPLWTSYVAQSLAARTVTRTLTFNGPFPMKVRTYAAGGGGETSTAEVFVVRTNTDPNPTGNFTFTTTQSGSTWNAAFTSTSTDDVMPIPTQTWSFAGPFATWPGGSGLTFAATGLTPGNHPVKLFVKDGDNRTDEITRTVALPGTPPTPTWAPPTRTTVSPTESDFTWNGVPGADGYEVETFYRNDQHQYVNPTTEYVAQPSSAGGATMTSTVHNNEHTCSVQDSCFRTHVRAYFVIDGVRYTSAWSGDIWWGL